jgi:hypothetical protein
VGVTVLVVRPIAKLTDLELVLGRLHQLVGMNQVKNEINNLINFLKVQALRRDQKN